VTTRTTLFALEVFKVRVMPSNRVVGEFFEIRGKLTRFRWRQVNRYAVKRPSGWIVVIKDAPRAGRAPEPTRAGSRCSARAFGSPPGP
jgi:hypothetical protein